METFSFAKNAERSLLGIFVVSLVGAVLLAPYLLGVCGGGMCEYQGTRFLPSALLLWIINIPLSLITLSVLIYLRRRHPATYRQRLTSIILIPWLLFALAIGTHAAFYVTQEQAASEWNAQHSFKKAELPTPPGSPSQ